MIEKFVYGEGAVRLRNAVDTDTGALEENIFQIDSLSLLIGDNGAGKTRLLDAIWDAMDRPESDSWRRDCQPVFHGAAPAGADDVGVILFSHAPNWTARKESKSGKCIDATPAAGSRFEPEALFSQQDRLEKIIGGQPRFEVELMFSPNIVLIRCVELVLAGALDLPAKWTDFAEPLADARYHYEWQVDESAIAPRAVGIDSELDWYVDSLAEGIFDAIRRQHGPARATALLAALHFSVKESEQADQFLMCMLQRYLRFRAKETPPEPDGELFARFRARKFAVERFVMGKYGDVVEAPGRKDDADLVHITVAISGPNGLKAVRRSALAGMVTAGWHQVSSGQWALVTQFVKLEDAFSRLVRKKGIRSVLVLIDEGDAFLHLEWQRQYISMLDDALARMKTESNGTIQCVQALIATHSPMLASDVPASYVNRLNNHRIQPPAPAFAAPYQALLNTAFGAKTIGAHATRTIIGTVDNLRAGQVSARDRYVVGIVDDPIIKRELESLLGSAR